MVIYLKKTVFDLYPQLSTLKGLIPEGIIKREVIKKAKEFQYYFDLSQARIKTVKLSDIFSEEIEKVCIRLENFLGHWGNASIEQVCKIALIVKYLRPKNIFEIGTYNGMTTLQMALNTPKNCQIYTLDIGSEMALKSKNKLSLLDKYVATRFMKIFKTEIGSYFKAHNARNKITQLMGDSAVFDFTPYHKLIDLVYIDGAHDYNNKRSDSENAFKMLNKYGVVIWDNYGDIVNPDVTRYLYDLSKQVPLYHLRGTFLVVYRSKT